LKHLANPFDEIPKQFQSFNSAFFRMKLGSPDIVAMYGGGEGNTVIGYAGNPW
jgi:hypothetical protein